MNRFLYLYYRYSIDRPSGEDAVFRHDFDPRPGPFAECLRRAEINMAAGIKRLGFARYLTIDDGSGLFHREIHVSGNMFIFLTNDAQCGPVLAAAKSRVDYFDEMRQATLLIATPTGGPLSGLDVRVMHEPVACEAPRRPLASFMPAL